LQLFGKHTTVLLKPWLPEILPDIFIYSSLWAWAYNQANPHFMAMLYFYLPQRRLKNAIYMEVNRKLMKSCRSFIFVMLAII